MADEQVADLLRSVQADVASIKNRLTVFELRQGASESQLLSIDGRLLALRQSMDSLATDMRRLTDALAPARERV